jgi:hypothetical protein
MITERPRTYGKLLSENESLRKRLEEAEQTVEAIRNGEGAAGKRGAIPQPAFRVAGGGVHH